MGRYRDYYYKCYSRTNQTLTIMSILRYPPRTPKFGVFGSCDDSQVKYDDSAEDMPVLYDRMAKGQTPRTRVATYSSSQFTDEQMLSQMPIKINDPTDLNFVEYKEKVQEQREKQQQQQEQN